MLNRSFFNINMTYKRVIVFAIIVAAFCASMLIIPFTIHTSLANPGTYLEAWILFALIIIMNCQKPLEAGAKTFIFFLISQPLIYLLQVPFSSLGWQLFMFYPKWGLLTLLTFPGAMIAWYIKKDNLLSSIILAIATSYLVFQGMDFLASALDHFPHQFLSFLFCYSVAFILIRTLLKNKRNIIVCSLITFLAFLFSIYVFILLMGFAF